jgi:hypothetical protein
MIQVSVRVALALPVFWADQQTAFHAGTGRASGTPALMICDDIDLQFGTSKDKIRAYQIFLVDTKNR